MELDPKTLSHEISAKLFLGLVVPRPIAVVSSISPAGEFNLAPFSYYNVVSDSPMVLSFSMTGPKPDGADKDTLRNVRPISAGGTGEFVVNVATENFAMSLAKAGKSLPYGESEFKAASLTSQASQVVKPPRVAEARACFECRTLSITPVGTAHLVLGEVVHIHVQSDLLDERMRVDVRRLQPVGRLAGAEYCKVTEIFEVTV